MLNLTIDGKKIEVKEGTTILNAARQANIDIPTLCDHPQLTPYGGCRLCLVEVEGARTLQPSCTTPVSNNMVVKTDTEKIRKARKFALTMIFSERNHFCPYCQVSGGDCELQNSAYVEGMTYWPIQPNWKPYSVDASHPYIVLEQNRCILCRRCVRACGELVGNFTLDFENRGAESMLVADFGVPLGESSCISCGTCVQVCPTGAIIDRWSAYQGKETEVETTKTICLGCSLGCGIDVLTRDNRLIRIEGDWEGEINQGVICEVGRFFPVDDQRDRLLTPLVRKDGNLKAATWDEALMAAANLLKSSNGKFAGVVSTRLSLEALRSFQELCNALDAKSIGSTEEGAPVQAASEFFEKSGKPFESRFEEIKDADCFLLVGEDVTKDHQVVSFFIKRRIPAGATVIQVASKPTGFDKFANFTFNIDDHSMPKFVNELAVLANCPNADFNSSAKIFGVSADDLKKAVEAMTFATQSGIIFGSRSEAANVDLLEAVLMLSNKTKAKVITTKGNINSLGALMLGLNNPIDTSKAEMILLALCDEELSQQMMKKFDKDKNLVVFSSYISPLTASADVVLPVANWLEEGGHFVNFDGHLLEAKAALQAAEGICTNLEAIRKLASKLDIPISADWEEAIKSSKMAEISKVT